MRCPTCGAPVELRYTNGNTAAREQEATTDEQHGKRVVRKSLRAVAGTPHTSVKGVTYAVPIERCSDKACIRPKRHRGNHYRPKFPDAPAATT